jgi:glycine cleavage system aminomethyltransferase T
VEADPRLVPDEGAQITEARVVATGTPALGRFTSSYGGSTLGRSIVLALVAGGPARTGATVHVQLPAGAVPAEIVSAVFYDPAGARLDV